MKWPKTTPAQMCSDGRVKGIKREVYVSEMGARSAVLRAARARTVQGKRCGAERNKTAQNSRTVIGARMRLGLGFDRVE